MCPDTSIFLWDHTWNPPIFRRIWTGNTMQKIGFQTTKTNETPAKNWNMPFDVVVMRVAWVTGVTGLTKVIGVARVTSMNKELIFSLICLVFRVGTMGSPSHTRNFHPPQKKLYLLECANMFIHIQTYWKSKIPPQGFTLGTLSVKGQHRNGAFRKKKHTNRSRFCRQDFQRVSWFFLLRINKHCLWNFSPWRHKQAKR